MTDLSEKFPGLVSLLKLQNVLILLLAQLMIAHFVFYRSGLMDLLLRRRFVFMLLATGSAISAGYIINHFYHLRRDMINRPAQTLLEQKLPVHLQLYLYFFLNFLTLVFAAFISLRAVLFFAVYIFLIWLYFHKLQAFAFWRELFVTFLTVYPFFGVMLFFKKWNALVLLMGILFALLLMLKELIKNHLTLRGDMAQGIHTVLTVKGERFQKRLFFLIGLIAFIPLLMLYQMDLPLSYRRFLVFIGLMLLVETALYLRGKYVAAYSVIKIIIISGLFALFLL